MAHYIFNVLPGDAAGGPASLLRAGLWGVGRDEPHRDALTAGDLVLVYLGAPERVFVGRAELGSGVHEWTPAEARAYPGASPGGVSLARAEEWEPPVPMDAVLSRIDRSQGARADFDARVVRITAHEYETALAVANAQSTASIATAAKSSARYSSE